MKPAIEPDLLQSTETKLAKFEGGGEVARREPTTGEMMQVMLNAGITAENTAAFKELVLLEEHREDRKAKKEFATAFIALQREIPTIKATKIIPDRNGNMRSSFAPFEEIDAQAGPICLKHGFVYSFSEGPSQPGKITKICTLLHESGHERSNPYSVRIGQGPPGCSESQADGSAHSYAKRGALCDALNIVVSGIDNDAKLEGAPVTPEIADELERRVALTNSNREAFLKFAGNAKSFSDIPASAYDRCNEMLRRKEQGK